MDYLQFISPQTQFYQLPQSFQLESGQSLPRVQVAYRTWGRLNATRDNAVLVCHAFTGWADLETWWGPLVGPGCSLDPDQDFIVCSNILGSCYGTTGPTSLNPATDAPYGPDFPAITVRDMVHLQYQLLQALGIQRVQLVIGGSLGGMQVLEWALLYPAMVRAIAPIATSGRHSAWCIALSEAQRQAIYADPNWQGGHYTPECSPRQGLAVARTIAMSTYRSWQSFTLRYGRSVNSSGEFLISTYLHHQGEKLVERFDANTYITLSQAMDRHDITRPGQSYEVALQTIHQPALVVSVDSDILYPPVDQQELANFIPNAQLALLSSPHGHDAFLMELEMEELNTLIGQFRQSLAVCV